MTWTVWWGNTEWERGRNLTVKNATRAAQNAKDLVPRTALCALPTWCCTWMTAAAFIVATPQIPLIPRIVVTARTLQMSASFEPVR